MKNLMEKNGGMQAAANVPKIRNSTTLPPISRMKERYANKSENENKFQMSKFRYTSRNMIVLKLAIKNSMEKKGGNEAMFARMMIIKAKHTSKREWHERRKQYKTQPSRLSNMSDAQNIPRQFTTKSLVKIAPNNMISATLPPTSRMKEKYDNKSEIQKKLPFQYTSKNMILLKSAMKNSMEKKGGKEAMLAKTMIVKAKRTSKSGWHEHRQKFQTRPSRLSYMSDAQDIPRNFKSFYYQGSLYINSFL
ncbi:hypothetical protein A2U01_0009074 [Trifolium medium]|uniref:Uncharacterized protein n=1 Tax=Trifolium medium TaxID=97028 RepID=A0A392MLE7_9FABA|nr:hypothetical protein [Trifolium medium]